MTGATSWRGSAPGRRGWSCRFEGDRSLSTILTSRTPRQISLMASPTWARPRSSPSSVTCPASRPPGISRPVVAPPHWRPPPAMWCATGCRGRGDRQMNKVLHAARCQVRNGGPGRVYYLHKIDEGNGKLEALRKLRRSTGRNPRRRGEAGPPPTGCPSQRKHMRRKFQSTLQPPARWHRTALWDRTQPFIAQSATTPTTRSILRSRS